MNQGNGELASAVAANVAVKRHPAYEEVKLAAAEGIVFSETVKELPEGLTEQQATEFKCAKSSAIQAVRHLVRVLESLLRDEEVERQREREPKWKIHSPTF